MPQDLAVPGRMVDFEDKPLATFAVGDAKYAWDWNWKELNGGPYTRPQLAGPNAPKLPVGWAKELHSINDFRYQKQDELYQKRPLFESSSWILPDGYTAPVLRQPNYPVQRAFRTVGLVRGQYPYALVLDDIQKDNAVHHYDWVLSVEPDVQIEKFVYPKQDEKNTQLFDVFLTGTTTLNKRGAYGNPANGEPLLLVRVLERERAKSAAPPVTGDAYLTFATRRLVVPTDAVAPNYKVLLYPFRQGDPVPVTTWNNKHDTLTVTIGKQKDTITFKPSTMGKTGLVITRDNSGQPASLITTNRPIAPLREPTP